MILRLSGLYISDLIWTKVVKYDISSYKLTCSRSFEDFKSSKPLHWIFTKFRSTPSRGHSYSSDFYKTNMWLKVQVELTIINFFSPLTVEVSLDRTAFSTSSLLRTTDNRRTSQIWMIQVLDLSDLKTCGHKTTRQLYLWIVVSIGLYELEGLFRIDFRT